MDSYSYEQKAKHRRLYIARLDVLCEFLYERLVLVNSQASDRIATLSREYGELHSLILWEISL